ncbi:monocarboxylate transporter 5 isoform X1 [Neodiprion lecontei]|uniref:Monocarboxylate transporter 5 isoform X1 n=1 Tax=Neodiprion lecontei TaxID=441921 RepID=A0ABM3FEF0_NEOLC|nr:monocarboxylate transporter 5 isoform X1 [Neodiprion lecontei]XP_046586396.1 monocarboxylate transporter 5 isoform X1 [Neodiprion lecontei]
MAHEPVKNRIKKNMVVENCRKSEIDKEDEGITPPDGGWGWVIVFASFMIHVITDGVTYSFGLFYIAFLDYFEEGKGKTSWIASLLVGITYCSGPISSSFVNKYGCRTVTIAGTILASTSLLASVFAQNILTLYFTIGIGTGIGFGLIYLPAIVSVTCYFEKYRSLATGIAVCGSGLGTLVFAPLTGLLITTYGWRGATLIISALVLNCIILGVLIRPLEAPKKDISLQSLHFKENGSIVKVAGENEQKALQATGGKDRNKSNERQVKYTAVKMEDDVGNNLRAALSQPILLTKSLGHHTQTMTRSYGSSIMNRRDIFYQGSLDNVRAKSYVSDNTEMRMRSYYGSLENSVENVRMHSSLRSLPNGNTKHSDNYESPSNAEENVDIFCEMLEFSLLKDPVFVLFTLSNFCTSIGFNVPYVYLAAQAEERGIPAEDASWLLGIIGIANTLGRIILGYISDKTWINRLIVYNSCLTICGIATGFSSLCTTFTAFAFYSVVFGVTAGAYVGLTSVILVDLLGLDRLTNAFGLLLLFQGLASLLGPPIAGWLHDGLGSYDPGFWVAGSMIAISGLMLFFIPVLQRYLRKKAEKSQRISVVF